jgi:hypothetical protein
MEDVTGRSFVHRKLKPYFLWYMVITVICLILLTTAMVFEKRMDALQIDETTLLRIKSSLVNANKTIGDMDGFVKMVATVTPPDLESRPPSHYLHNGLDRIKSVLPAGQLEIGKIEDRGDETAMPVTIAGPLTNYQGFLAGLAGLQDMRFPFFLPIGVILKTVKNQNAESSLSYEIRAYLTMPKTGKEEGTLSVAPVRPVRTQFHGKGAS